MNGGDGWKADVGAVIAMGVVTADIALLPFSLLMIALAQVVLPPVNMLYRRAFMRQPLETGRVVNAYKQVLSKNVVPQSCVTALAIAFVFMSVTLSGYFVFALIGILLADSLILTSVLRRKLASPSK